jgi:hypothetical protein
MWGALSDERTGVSFAAQFLLKSSPYNPSARTTVENTFSNSPTTVFLRVNCCRGNLFVCDRCLETALHATIYLYPYLIIDKYQHIISL